MSRFDVQFEGLARARQESSDVEEALRAARDRASASVQELTGGGWSGQAAHDFVAGWHEWEAGATDLLAALADLGAAIETSAAEYHHRDLLERQRVQAAGAPVLGHSGLNL